jgi:glutaredoxin
MTKRWLEARKIQIQEYNVEEDYEALKYITGMGFKSVPVVFWGNESWAGFQPDRLQEKYEKTDGDIEENTCPCGIESVRCTGCW